MPRWAAAIIVALSLAAPQGCVQLPKEPANLSHRPAELRRDENDQSRSSGASGGSAERAATSPRTGSTNPEVDGATARDPATAQSSQPQHSAAADQADPAPQPAPALEAATQAPPRDTPEELLLGQFLISPERPIIDGDTIRVEGLDATLRLLSIDTEEVFRSDADRRAAEMDFDSYARAKQGDNPYPVGYPTPMGEEGSRFAKRFFDGHTSVLLEYDHPSRTRGFFGRHLVYVFVVKNGEWVNYNLEAVRAGMSPYYTKYGYSQRFHDDFVEAQEEAMSARRGIWSGDAECYPDYDVRLAWWKQRADTIQRFYERHGDDPRFVEVGADDAMDRLLAFEGEVVTIFGAVGEEFRREDPPFIVPIQHRRGNDFAIVAFQREDLERLNLSRYTGEFTYLRGKVTTYRGSPQMLANNVERVWTD